MPKGVVGECSAVGEWLELPCRRRVVSGWGSQQPPEALSLLDRRWEGCVGGLGAMQLGLVAVTVTREEAEGEVKHRGAVVIAACL